MLKPEELPAPDTLIDYGNGTFGPLMFHFATEDDKPSFIANNQGFDHMHIEMFDVMDDDDPLVIEYGEGSPNVIGKWTPPERDGWTLIGRNDSENGPVAHYIRKSQPRD